MKSKRMKTVDCKAIYRHLCENLDAEINSPACAELRSHILHCRNCTAYLDSLKKTIRLYRNHALPEVTLPIEERLFAVLTERTGASSRRATRRS